MGCVKCHMAEAVATESGGHTFNVSYDGEVNAAGCAPCHSEDDAITLVENTQDAIEVLLGELHTVLVDKGVLNDASGLMNTGEWDNDIAGAFYNYKFIEEDRSLGVHNFKYAKTLLENSIAALQ